MEFFIRAYFFRFRVWRNSIPTLQQHSHRAHCSACISLPSSLVYSQKPCDTKDTFLNRRHSAHFQRGFLGILMPDPHPFLSISSKLKHNGQIMKTDIKKGHVLFYLKNVSPATIFFFFILCCMTLFSEVCLKASIYYRCV